MITRRPLDFFNSLLVCLIGLLLLAGFASAQSLATSVKPVGFAYVNSDGSVDTAKSMNITSANIKTEGDGIYGFRNLSFTPKNVQVTLAFETAHVTGDNRTGARAFVGDCGFIKGKDQACVAVQSGSDSSSTKEPFFVVFF